MNARFMVAAVGSLMVGCGGSGVVEPTSAISTSVQALTTANGRDVNGIALNGRDVNGRDVNGRDVNGRDVNGRDVNGRDVNGRDVNGADLNGTVLNGRDVNGRDVNGRDVNGSVWAGVELDSLAYLELEGSELVAITDGIERRGADLEGAEFAFRSSDRVLRRMRVAEVTTSPSQHDVFSYLIDVRVGSSWEPLCGTDAVGAPVPAIPLSGTWNERVGKSGGDHTEDGRITFACDGYALSKCVKAGYKPWVPGGRALHQACTRMIRADYCGDGRSHTEDGVWVNLYDGFGIQLDTEAWTFEAEWDADGARCLSSPRLERFARHIRCERRLQDDACGSTEHFQTGTLLMSEYQP